MMNILLRNGLIRILPVASIATCLVPTREGKEVKRSNISSCNEPPPLWISHCNRNTTCHCEVDNTSDTNGNDRLDTQQRSSSTAGKKPPQVESRYSSKNTIASVPSAFRRALAYFHLMRLPIPRILIPNDPAFTYPSLRKGLRQRRLDEIQLKNLEKEATDAAKTGDPQRIAQVVTKMCDIAYGKGVTPQDRQDFLIRYGCAAWSDEALSLIYDISKDRGIVEIGAGNGQWARAITDYYIQQKTTGGRQQRPPNFEFVMAFDDYSSLPLSPAIYHRGTKPARDHFYPNVRQATYERALSSLDTQNRVLLLVFPPPGPLARLTVRKYISRFGGKWNDIVIYVGEGVGGVNADESFFSMLEDGSWVLLHCIDLPPSVGGKGCEKLFVFQRCSSVLPGTSISPDDLNMNQVLKYNN